MKRILLFALSVLAVNAISAQCTADYDFGTEPFGVSPDPVAGESFEVATVNMPYVDIIHILVPTQANDIDETLPEGVPIDSVILAGVSMELAGVIYTPEEIGLSVICNNNDDSPNPCTFLGGVQYCASLEGTPTQMGTYNLVINVQGWTTIFGNPIAQDISFDQYVFIVNEDGTFVSEYADDNVTLGQNIPNPADGMTSIPFTMESPGIVKLTVVNLLGEVLINDQVQGKRGQNSAKLDVGQLDSGIYLYSIETKGKKLTKRLVINR